MSDQSNREPSKPFIDRDFKIKLGLAMAGIAIFTGLMIAATSGNKSQAVASTTSTTDTTVPVTTVLAASDNGPNGPVCYQWNKFAAKFGTGTMSYDEQRSALQKINKMEQTNPEGLLVTRALADLTGYNTAGYLADMNSILNICDPNLHDPTTPIAGASGNPSGNLPASTTSTTSWNKLVDSQNLPQFEKGSIDDSTTTVPATTTTQTRQNVPSTLPVSTATEVPLTTTTSTTIPPTTETTDPGHGGWCYDPDSGEPIACP
jgi:hypothetical protein